MPPRIATLHISSRRFFEILQTLAPRVYALTAGGPERRRDLGRGFPRMLRGSRNAGCGARLTKLRQHTDKPVRHLVLTHYHAVRALGASAFEAQTIIASDSTRRLIAERGKEHWDSELGRMPR